ncbi:MAG: hypothetical protein ACW981_04195 [Candidatus Hodarchaeales archaeon]|jgi:hypothetical protein
MKLPFSHGLEIENHLVDIKTSKLIVGEYLLKSWDVMFERAFQFLSALPKRPDTPDYIKKKIKNVRIVEEKKRDLNLKFITIDYVVNKQVFPANAIGPDPNISQITWLLEMVLPPCEMMEEIKFWIETLYESVSEPLSEYGIKLLPIGLHPFEEEFRSGLSGGEHHHIGGLKPDEKISAYNLIRNFVPHLISLTACSPFIEGAPTGDVIIKELDNEKIRIIPKNSTRSIRLKYNTGQLGPNSVNYLPWMPLNGKRKDFASYVKKEPPEDRFVDVNPFTDYNTIELRFFDTSPYIELKLAMVLILQAICLKARKLKGNVPEVPSSNLFNLRLKAIDFGMHGSFIADKNIDGEFGKFYNYSPITKNENRKIFEAVLSLIYYLEPEITSLEGYEEYIKPFFSFFVGTSYIEGPYNIADLLIYRWEAMSKNGGRRNFFLILDEVQNYFDSLENISFNDFKSLTQNIYGIKAKVKTSPIKKQFKKVDISQRQKKVIKKETEKVEVKAKVPVKKKREPIKKVSKKLAAPTPVQQVVAPVIIETRLSKKISNIQSKKSGIKIKRPKKRTVSNAFQRKTDISTKKRISIKESAEIEKKKQKLITNYVQAKTTKKIDSGKKGKINKNPQATQDLIHSSLFKAKVIDPKESLLRDRLTDVMKKKRKSLSYYKRRQKVDFYLKNRKLQKMGKLKLNIIPQDFRTHFFALLQLEIDKSKISEFLNREYFISLLYTKNKENFIYDYGPFRFNNQVQEKIIMFPILINIEEIPRLTRIKLEFRTSDYIILIEEVIEIPEALKLNDLGILINDFEIDETIGSSNFLVDINIAEKYNYKSSLQVLVFNQTGMVKLFETNVKTKNETNLQIKDHIFISPNIHLGRVILGAVLQGKEKDSATWSFLEFLPRKVPLVEWSLVGWSEDKLKRKQKYQFLPEVKFNGILREPELVISLIDITDSVKQTKKSLAKDRLKRTNTYSGQTKILSKIQFKLNSSGRYKIILEAVSRDGLVPNGLIGKPLEFLVE